MAAKKADRPVTYLCRYTPKKGKEKAFLALINKHYPAVKKAGLATAQKPIAWRGKDKKGKTFFMEIFQWKSVKALSSAHNLPDVMKVWEPMGSLSEKMVFEEVDPLTLAKR
jgi:hypothetical protein